VIASDIDNIFSQAFRFRNRPLETLGSGIDITRQNYNIGVAIGDKTLPFLISVLLAAA